MASDKKIASHAPKETIKDVSRRLFIKQAATGLAVTGIAGLTLVTDAGATEPNVEAPGYGKPLVDPPSQNDVAGPSSWQPTEDNILGPYHRAGAPFRGKTTPPLAPGTVLLISGRVWSLATRKPIAGAILDIWHADADGRYDNDGSRPHPGTTTFINRTRLVTDATGFYEFEAIHPGPYRISPSQWRPSHIHYMVRSRNHAPLVTQLYFSGDPHNATDQFIRKSLIIDLEQVQVTATSSYERGRFDIVLAPA